MWQNCGASFPFMLLTACFSGNAVPLWAKSHLLVKSGPTRTFQITEIPQLHGSLKLSGHIGPITHPMQLSMVICSIAWGAVSN